MKKITYLLLPVCMGLSVVTTDCLASDAILLSPDQMDQVTAGLGAVVNVSAIGISSFFANTRTQSVALTAVSGNNSRALGGYVEVAGGGATAVAAGQGASTSTTVTPATSTNGWTGTTTYVAEGHFKSSLVEINANLTYTSGNLFVNPL